MMGRDVAQQSLLVCVERTRRGNPLSPGPCAQPQSINRRAKQRLKLSSPQPRAQVIWHRVGPRQTLRLLRFDLAEQFGTPQAAI